MILMRLALLVVGGLVLCGCEAKKEADVESNTVTAAATTAPVPAAQAAPSYPGDLVDGAGTVTPSGLKYFDIVVGQGPQPAGPTTTVGGGAPSAPRTSQLGAATQCRLVAEAQAVSRAGPGR